MSPGNANLKLHVLQLGRIEEQELIREGNGLFESETASIATDAKGELLTAALFAWLTKAAVLALVNWLIARMDTARIEQEILIERPDGSKIRFTLVISSRDPAKARAEVLDQINKKLLEFGQQPIDS
jgi:hypothetical protein